MYWVMLCHGRVWEEGFSREEINVLVRGTAVLLKSVVSGGVLPGQDQAQAES